MRASWQRYWFSPAPLFDLAVLRIAAVGCQLFLEHLAFIPLHEFHLGPQLSALARTAEFPDDFFRPLMLLQFFLSPFEGLERPSFELLQIVWWITLASGLLAFAGAATNPSLILFTLGSAFLQAHQYSFGELHHPEAVMMIALGALALSPCGRVLSVDGLLSRKKPGPMLEATSAFAGWPIRLVTWLFMLMYLSASFSKLYTSGLGWMNGYTLQYYFIDHAMRTGNELGLWLSQFHGLMIMAQCIVILFQSTFVLAVIYPRLRWIYVPLALGFHASIYVLSIATFFQWIALYVAFIPWSRFIRWLSAGTKTGDHAEQT